jgi:hypothetical protein
MRFSSVTSVTPGVLSLAESEKVFGDYPRGKVVLALSRSPFSIM